MPKRKAATLPSLIKKLDRIFSTYIRLRDADESGTCACVTCGKLDHYKNMHCGHFIKRQHQSVRFDERNTAAQCVRCNLHMGGCQDEYGAHISQKYGHEVLYELLRLKRTAKKWTRDELNEMIQKYQSRVHELSAGRVV